MPDFVGDVLDVLRDPLAVLRSLRDQPRQRSVLIQINAPREPEAVFDGNHHLTTKRYHASTGALWIDWFWCDPATVIEAQSPSALPALEPDPWLLDRQGWSTLVAGALLLLISFTTNDGDDNLLQLGSLPAAVQVGAPAFWSVGLRGNQGLRTPDALQVHPVACA